MSPIELAPHRNKQRKGSSVVQGLEKLLSWESVTTQVWIPQEPYKWQESMTTTCNPNTQKWEQRKVTNWLLAQLSRRAQVQETLSQQMRLRVLREDSPW